MALLRAPSSTNANAPFCPGPWKHPVGRQEKKYWLSLSLVTSKSPYHAVKYAYGVAVQRRHKHTFFGILGNVRGSQIIIFLVGGCFLFLAPILRLASKPGSGSREES